MILRYFYIDKYNEAAQNLDVNLGGKYKFHYIEAQKTLQITENTEYVKNLYEEYDVISDVSAILGKNSAGKTTVLRMINSIFNGFDIYNNKQYIILFEKECNYILYTNYQQIKYNENSLDKIIMLETGKYFNAIDILKDVGLIYFSNIFDKATPFQGNANLIDISTNYLFEQFYQNITVKKKDHERINIMEEYKSDNILSEIDFLLDMKHELRDSELTLLFDIPSQIKLGFAQILPNYGNDPFCDNEEYNRLLAKIYNSLEDYLCENQDFKEESILFFQREILFYFIFDELRRFCREDKYNALYALNYWISKIENKDWEISNYYQEILEKLRHDTLSSNDFSILWEENERAAYDSYQEEDFISIRDIFERLYILLNTSENSHYQFILNEIAKIIDFLEEEQLENNSEIAYYLKHAAYSLEEFQDDLILHDYDLYNISCIYEAYGFVEKALEIYSGEKFIHYFSDDISVNNLETAFDDDEIEEIQEEFDPDTENHLNLLQKVIKTLIDFTKRYEYSAEANMLSVMLDRNDILEFIYNFQELECETIVLDVRRNDISSGHSAYLDMCARINSARKSGEIFRKKNVILLIDEGDIYLHPEKQLAYMNNLMKLLQILYKEKKVQLIITSNSPFIISDIQSSNILYLEQIKNKIEVAKKSISNTFAANVNVLLLDSFFVKNGLIGEYAFNKINRILKDLQDDKQANYDQIENIIKIIGEPMIRRKLETMLFHNTQHNNIQREIQYYENMLKKIRRPNN